MDAELVSAALVTGMVIDGEWLERGEAGELPHIDPATGRAHRNFPAAGPAQVDAAVRAARAGVQRWRAAGPARRKALLAALAAALDDAVPDLDGISALERGAPISGGGPGGASAVAGSAFDYAAGWVDRLTGSTIPIRPDEVFDFTMTEPVGVVAVLPSWNGPLWSIAAAVAPALAAGCAVVLKAPELAPFSCQYFGRICLEAGLPDGVVNVLTGGPEVGAALVGHRGVDKIHFTGGTETARRIQATAAHALTPMVLELGGKSANLVFPDADLDRAANHAAGWIPRNAGQSCTGPSRLLVHESVYDEMVERVVDQLAKVVIGDPFDPATTMGPVISDAARTRILDAVEQACARGDGVLRTGGPAAADRHGGGYFVPPTVLVDVDNRSDIAQRELFGPVLTVSRFRTEEEAITMANDSVYGLAGYVHTRDISRVIRVAGQIEAGSIGVNGGGAPAGLLAPFGGVKDSGYGTEGGVWGIREFLRTKNVMVQL